MFAIDTEIIFVAIKNLKQQGIRSYLTLLGVIIGIASIVALISIGQGLNAAVSEQFDKLGTNTLFVSVGMSMQSTSRAATTQIQLEDVDAKRIEKIPDVERVIKLYSTSTPVRRGSEEASVTVLSFDPKDGEPLLNTGVIDIEEGRLFTEQETFVALAGYDFAKETFDRDLKPRTSITINGKKIKIIATLKKSAQTIGSRGPNTSAVIFIPEKGLKQIFDIKNPSFLFVKTFSGEQVKSAKTRIERYLEKKYGEKNYSVSTAEEVAESVQQVLTLLSVVLVGIAMISLIVGGVGIMSSMYTAVLERTKEIGIMKAIGATNETILGMFLIEAGLIGLIGGLIGTGIGLGTSELIAKVGQFSGINLKSVITPEQIIAALLFSMIVGILSGLYPAREASRLDPAEALRYE